MSEEKVQPYLQLLVRLSVHPGSSLFSGCLGRTIEYLKVNHYLLQFFSSRREGLGGY